jgi:hemerythrin-like metal-binding protein
LHLTWKDAYGCGEPTIDDQHHELFDLGNNLIDTTLVHAPSMVRVSSALGHLFDHVKQHFADEEAWLAARRYGRLQAHRIAHANLLFRATQLRAKVDLASPDVRGLVSFVADDVVAKHMLTADRDYYSLIARDCGASVSREPSP